MLTAGIDIGSTTCKAVILNDNKILGTLVIPSGTLPGENGRIAMEQCSRNNGLKVSDFDAVATTGYGRRLANFGDMVITEIKACALGVHYISGGETKIRTVIDVGGQDTKIISVTGKGDVEDFAMNDKCAAGTGRFLEMLANKLGFSYEDFVLEALKSEVMIHMNSTCAVFAESEVVSLLAKNVKKADIAAAAHTAIAERIGSMIRRVGQKEAIAFTGGGARNRALIKAVEESLNKKVVIPEEPQIIVALGAAIAAGNKLAGKGEGNL